MLGACPVGDLLGTGFGKKGDEAVGAIAEMLRVPPERVGGGLFGGLIRQVTSVVGGLGPRVTELNSVRPGVVPVNPTRSLSDIAGQATLNLLSPLKGQFDGLMKNMESLLFKADDVSDL